MSSSSSSDESDASVLVGFNQLSDESVVDFADEEDYDDEEAYDDNEDENDDDDDDDFQIDEDDNDMVDLTKKHDVEKSNNESDADPDNAFRSALERQVEQLLRKFVNYKIMLLFHIKIEELLGRARAKADLGHLGDFPTELQDTLDSFELDVEEIKIQEVVKTFKFRGASGRRRQ